VEFPPSVLRMPLRNLPFAGGIYLRVFPYQLVRWGMGRLARHGRPALVYIHPPEFDPHKPRLKLPLGSRVLHYSRLDAFAKKVPRLLREFRFVPIGELLCSLDEGRLERWSPEGDQPPKVAAHA